MVIVGAGEAGARAAIALREAGWAGPVTLVGEEAHPPYERPPLSKAVMQAADEPGPPAILGPGVAERLQLRLLAGLRASRIDRAAHTLILSDGSVLPYGKLLLATGASARQLAVPGAGPADVMYLRSIADARALHRRLARGGHLVLVGAGFIGLELAASARARRLRVTVLESACRILARGVPEPVAAVVAARHVAAGVELRTGITIQRIEDRGGVHRITLGDGTQIDADGIVAGIGAVPNVELAAASGLAIDNGVSVNACLQTEDPDIFAAGDCCSFPHSLFGGRRIRLEAWRNAKDQAAVAARNMLGAQEAFAAVPWFWSDQYDLSIQTAGLADGTAAVVTRNLGQDGLVCFHIDRTGRLISASGVGQLGKIGREIRAAELLIAARARPDPAMLGDGGIRLKTLLEPALALVHGSAES